MLQFFLYIMETSCYFLWVLWSLFKEEKKQNKHTRKKPHHYTKCSEWCKSVPGRGGLWMLQTLCTPEEWKLQGCSENCISVLKGTVVCWLLNWMLWAWGFWRIGREKELRARGSSYPFQFSIRFAQTQPGVLCCSPVLLHLMCEFSISLKGLPCSHRGPSQWGGKQVSLK